MNSYLIEGKPARQANLSVEEMDCLKGFMLLTLKPVIYAANVADSDLANGNDLSKKLEEFAKQEGSTVVLVSAQVCLSIWYVATVCHEIWYSII